MQKEIAADLPEAGIQILGVNEVGQESENSTICEGRDLPWLQEVAAEPIWDLWHVTWRDVFVLDGRNEVYAVYNLSVHNLSVAANYDSLKTLLLQAWGDE